MIAFANDTEGRMVEIPRADVGQHIYHHSDKQCVTLNIKVEKNSRGYNFEVTVIGAPSVDEAMALILEANEKLRAEYERPNKKESV